MTVHNLIRLTEPEVEVTPAGLFEAPRAIADDFTERAARVAAVAALHADEVDRDGRFPVEAIMAAKALGLMGLLAPRSPFGPVQLTRAIARAARMIPFTTRAFVVHPWPMRPSTAPVALAFADIGTSAACGGSSLARGAARRALECKRRVYADASHPVARARHAAPTARAARDCGARRRVSRSGACGRLRCSGSAARPAISWLGRRRGVARRRGATVLARLWVCVRPRRVCVIWGRACVCMSV